MGGGKLSMKNRKDQEQVMIHVLKNIQTYRHYLDLIDDKHHPRNHHEKKIKYLSER